MSAVLLPTGWRFASGLRSLLFHRAHGLSNLHRWRSQVAGGCCAHTQRTYPNGHVLGGVRGTGGGQGKGVLGWGGSGPGGVNGNKNLVLHAVAAVAIRSLDNTISYRSLSPSALRPWSPRLPKSLRYQEFMDPRFSLSLLRSRTFATMRCFTPFTIFDFLFAILLCGSLDNSSNAWRSRRQPGGSLWRRGLSVVKRSSCAAGRSVAAAFLPISKPRAARSGAVPNKPVS